ncbi:complement factor H-related protein 4-like [Aegotheles albertisi]
MMRLQEIVCSPPRISHGDFRPQEDNYRVGDVITVQCNPGYQFKISTGKSTAECTRNGWVPDPGCIRKLCDYPAIENGGLSRSLENYRSYYFPMTFGQHAHYYCNNGYSTPSGEHWVQMVCSESGWSPEPKCFKKCNVRQLENGYFSHGRKVYKEGEGVKYVCNDGYRTEHGDGEVTCTKDDWFPPPSCIRGSTKNCQNIIFDNGYFVRRKETFHLQEKATYHCLSGFVTPEGQEAGETQCQENGWTPPPKCIRKGGKCGPPPVIENGDILSFPKKEYAQGTILEYKCPSLYILEGSRHITCTDGQWTSPPVCLAACTTSEEDMDRNNIELRWVARKKLYSTSGDTIDFQCKIGYVEDPDSSPFRVQCMEGTLEYPRCKPASTLLAPVQLVRQDCQVVFCKTTFQAVDPTLRCPQLVLVDGVIPPTLQIEIVWDWIVRKSCDYPAIENGGLNATLEDYKEHLFPLMLGRHAHYYCNNGYSTPSGEHWVQMVCSESGWSPEPKCFKKCYVRQLENGHFSHGQKVYKEGEGVKYVCNDGYRTEHGDGEVTCTKDDWFPPPSCIRGSTKEDLRYAERFCSSGTMVLWNAISCECHIAALLLLNAPLLSDVSCGAAPEIPNAYITSTRQERYLPGTRVQYECDSNFQMMGGNYITCADGEWSQAPTCRDVRCEPPPEIAGGNIEGAKKSAYLPGESARYRCWQGFQMTGVSTVVCQSGTWTELPKCKGKGGKCGPPPVIENGDILSFPEEEYAQGTILEYKCPSLYILEGSRHITCTDGQWTSPPVCLAACTASEEDMNRNNIELRWVARKKLYTTSGDTIDFQCKIGYVEDPDSSPFRVQCMEGTLEYPRCKPATWKGVVDKTGPANGEQWDGEMKPEETSTNGISHSALHGVGHNVPHLKCFYTIARSMSNKPAKLEALAQSQRFDIIGISKTWWEESCDWSALLDGYKLFRRDRQGRRGGAEALYVVERLECTELTVGNDTTESLWVRISGLINNGDFIVDV